MRLSQRVMQGSLLLVGLIAVAGGALQMVLGQPETTARLDNVHRFMAGIYLGSGLIALWTAATITRHSVLILLLALGMFLGGIGRLVSMAVVGIPDPPALWLLYLVPELLLPLVILLAWRASHRPT
jgi:hypothetical protein